MSGHTHHTDPLCPEREQPAPWPCCPWCLLLRTARLQGPVKTNGHTQMCWCATCFPAGYESVGRPE